MKNYAKKSQQLLIVILIVGALVFLFYSAFISVEKTRTIVIDGLADDWKGINPIAIREDYRIYKYADSKEIFLLFKPHKSIFPKTFFITGQIADPDFPKDVLTNIRTLNLTIYSDGGVAVRDINEPTPLGLEGLLVEFKNAVEMKISLNAMGMEYGKHKYEILVSDKDGIITRFLL